MWENICSTGTPSRSKWANATGSRRLRKPSCFKSSKSVVFKGFLVKTSLFQVCSYHDIVIPLSRLLARLKANKRGFGVVGLLFAKDTGIVITNINITKVFRQRTDVWV